MALGYFCQLSFASTGALLSSTVCDLAGAGSQSPDRPDQPQYLFPLAAVIGPRDGHVTYQAQSECFPGIYTLTHRNSLFVLQCKSRTFNSSFPHLHKGSPTAMGDNESNIQMETNPRDGERKRILMTWFKPWTQPCLKAVSSPIGTQSHSSINSLQSLFQTELEFFSLHLKGS